MLKAVLSTGETSQREVFELEAISRKRDGDLDLAQFGREAKMPWQTDGRRWHTVDRVGHNGQPCRWEGEALARLVDEIETRDAFRSADWNNRSVVEIAARDKQHGWFLHALTGDEWLLTLKFRVRRNTFKQDHLSSRLALKSLDDIDELPIYGRSGRVRVRNLKGPWQEVTVSVHWQREIDTSEFRSFLNEACESFRRKAEQTKLNPADLMPWKVLGRKWHLSRKGFPSSKRVLWNVDTLDTLLNQLLAVLDIPAIDWANKQVIHFRREGDQTTWASVHTKRRGGIDLTLFADSGKIALGKIANFGEQSEINLLANGQDAIKIRFTKANQVKSREWRQFLSEHASAR